MKNLLLLLSFAILLSGCKPDEFKTTIYTSDVQIAYSDEVIEVPILISFSLLGDDDQGIFDRVINASKKYLSPKSDFSKSKTMMGEVLVIETKIPMGSSELLSKYLQNNNRLATLLISNTDKGSFQISLEKTRYTSIFGAELNDINMMLDLDLPAKKSIFRVSSDSRTPIKVSALAVFVAKKPYLKYSRTLDRRDFVEIEFSGGDGSVYSEISPVINITN